MVAGALSATASVGGGAAALAGNVMGLEKATLRLKSGGLGGLLAATGLVGGGGMLRCRFNPKEITVSASSEWNMPQTPSAERPPTPQYIRSQSRTISMQLFFDDWESIAGDVSKDVETILSWILPTEESIKKELPNPPVVVFQWGSTKAFGIDAFLSSVRATYTMFRRDGTPVRATVDITLQEIPQWLKSTNPTSGGVGGQRTRIVSAGETLHSIAYREYGDPSYWRGLAAANRIEDPMRVPEGRSLLIPPAAEVAALS